MTKALSTKRSSDLIAILEKVADDDARVVKAAAKAFTVGRVQLLKVELMEEGFEKQEAIQRLGFDSREDFEIACEARRPNSESSVALRHCHERTGMRIRQATEQAPRTLNVAVMMPAPAGMTDEQKQRAPVIDVTATGG